MSLSHLRSVAIASVLLAAGMACDDPLSPEDVAGTYVLSSLRGESLPAVLWETETSEARLLADTLRLHADGSGTDVWLYEYTTALGPLPRRLEHLLEFEVNDGRLEGAYVCPPGTTCLLSLEVIRGVFTPEGLRLEVSRHGEGPIDFVRVE